MSKEVSLAISFSIIITGLVVSLIFSTLAIMDKQETRIIFCPQEIPEVEISTPGFDLFM